MKDLENKIQLVSQLIKATLEEFDLYVGVDSETEEFMFFDRKAYDNGKAKLGRVKMNEINVRK